jgi:hypothetical protein
MLSGVGGSRQAVSESPDLVTRLRELEGHEEPDVSVVFGQKNRDHPFPRARVTRDLAGDRRG